jgi:hypothetical protein
VGVQSSQLAEPWALDAGLQQMVASWYFGSRTHSFGEWIVHRVGAGADVQIGMRGPGLCAEIPRGIVVAVGGERVLSLMDVGRILRVAQGVGQSYPVAGMILQAGNKKDAWIPQTVLVGELGIEVLTWAGTGNPDAQACED